VFVGRGAGDYEGICTDRGGLAVVVDTNTPIPNGTGNFVRLDAPWLDDCRIVFRGQDAAGHYGIYLNDLGTGALSRIADTTTLMPPGDAQAFDVLRSPTLKGNLVGFMGQSADRSAGGVYAFDLDTGVLVAIADGSTPIPAGSGTFSPTDLGGPAIDADGCIKFAGGDGADQRGIYTHYDGNYMRVADLTTAMPGFGEAVTNFGGAGIAGGNVAFTVSCCAVPVGLPVAVFGSFDGAPCRIICVGDEFDGRVAHQARVGRQCISAHRIAFWGSCENGTQYGVYIAEFLPGDLDGDRDVDLSDLAQLLGHYGSTGTRTEGDINGNRRIGVLDLELLLVNYGVSYPG
jgi:hypothetical protein